MANIYDVDPNQLIQKAGEELKKEGSIKPPVWSHIVKTGVCKERPPANPDWWYVRAAAVLRSLYRLGPVGVSKLRKKYGGRQNRGFRPEKFKPASGNIIRKVLQQLEKAGLARQTQIGNMKGRVITPKGKSFLDKIAAKMYVKHVPKSETETEVKESQ